MHQGLNTDTLPAFHWLLGEYTKSQSTLMAYQPSLESPLTFSSFLGRPTILCRIIQYDTMIARQLSYIQYPPAFIQC